MYIVSLSEKAHSSLQVRLRARRLDRCVEILCCVQNPLGSDDITSALPIIIGVSGTLYSWVLFRTDVSENISPVSSWFLRLLGLHSCVTAESLLIGLSIEEYYMCSSNTYSILLCRS
jgi:hypothetical protein